MPAGPSILLLLAAAAAPAAARAAQAPPSVVLFYVDDLGWRDGGVLGSGFYETPHLDALAASGMRFTDAYSNGPNCAPSRASLLTGLDVPRHGIHTVAPAARGESANRALVPLETRTFLAPRFVTIAEALGARGYATAAIGKWHVGDDPREQGFEVAFGGSRAGHVKRHFSPYRDPALPDGPDGEALTERLTDEAIAFLRGVGERPFLLYLAHYAVHTPVQTEPQREARFAAKASTGDHANARYAGMVAAVDDSLGRVLAALDELGLAERTLFVFTSDNGGHLGFTSMAPLRGGKGMLYEGGVRVPLVVRWPGRVAPGSRCAAPVIGSDWFPTLLSAAGAAEDELAGLDGASLLPLLEGGGPPAPRALCWHFPAYLEARPKDPTPWRQTPAGSIRRGPFKLIERFEDGGLELYDLAADPGEAQDLAAERPELAAELRAELAAWRARVGARVPTERNPEFRPRAGAEDDGR